MGVASVVIRLIFSSLLSVCFSFFPFIAVLLLAFFRHCLRFIAFFFLFKYLAAHFAGNANGGDCRDGRAPPATSGMGQRGKEGKKRESNPTYW